MIQAVIFDCFGVLVSDALEAVAGDLRKTSPEKAEQIEETVVAANKGSISPQQSRATVARLLGVSEDEYVEIIRSREVLNQELLEYIGELRPRLKIGMLSNISGIENLERRFPDGLLEKYFDAIVASGSIGFAKPEARAYEITAQKLGVRLEDAVMVDDRQTFCMGARGTGMHAVQYVSFAQMKRELDALLDS